MSLPKMPVNFVFVRITTKLLIILMAIKPFIELSTIYPKLICQFFKHTLTRVSRMDWSSCHNLQLIFLFPFCQSLMEAFEFMWTTEVSFFWPSKTDNLFFLSAYLLIEWVKLSSIQSWTLLMRIIGHVFRKETNGIPLPYRYYNYCVILFGILNPLFTFQSYVNKSLAIKLNVFCNIYVDDILIYSSKKEVKYEKAVG